MAIYDRDRSATSKRVLQASDLLCYSDLSPEENVQFVSEGDTNHDGVIEYNEFVL